MFAYLLIIKTLMHCKRFFLSPNFDGYTDNYYLMGDIVTSSTNQCISLKEHRTVVLFITLRKKKWSRYKQDGSLRV